MDNIIYWIWLQLATGPASIAPSKLLDEFDGDIKKIYDAETENYKGLNLTPKTIKNMSDKSLEKANEILDWCNDNKVNVLCCDAPEYPQRLRSIPDFPIVLYYIGELYDFDNMLCLATVGTRQMTRYGRDTAYTFCHDLARSGAVVVSGMAAGIDTTCHRAALDAGGKTVAVIGCRINKVYPAQNREIMREIARNGLLITEYHPFYPTSPANFPQRNRIISGLCQGTIIFEADARSGSLITANRALSQDRRLYALPGRIGESGSLGTNTLIQNGAELVTKPSDILEEYSFLYNLNYSPTTLFDHPSFEEVRDSFNKKKKATEKHNKSTNKSKSKSKNTIPAPDIEIKDALQKQLYEMIKNDPSTGAEELTIPGRNYGEIAAALTIMELNGLIKQLPGNRYIRKN